MKTHTIKTPTAELLIVEMPEGYTLDYTYYSEDNETEIAFYLGEDCVQLKTFKGSYTLLGKPDEIAENEKWDVYKPYIGSIEKETAKESLLSLLESEIYWVNPFKKPDNYNLWAKYGDYTQYGVGLTTESLKWHEAEQKTFDRNRSIILVKN